MSVNTARTSASATPAGECDEVPAHVLNSHAGRGWPEARAHRLHGMEGQRECPRSKAHFSPARKRTAPGRLFQPAQENRKAGFRDVRQHAFKALRASHSSGTRAV